MRANEDEVPRTARTGLSRAGLHELSAGTGSETFRTGGVCADV